METYSSKLYSILNSVMEMEYDIHKDKFEIILSFINTILHSNYVYLNQVKCLYFNKFITPDYSTTVNNFIPKFKDVGLKINSKNKKLYDSFYILKTILNQVNFTLRKKLDINNNVFFSIIKKK
jgi:hypothetical protein